MATLTGVFEQQAYLTSFLVSMLIIRERHRVILPSRSRRMENTQYLSTSSVALSSACAVRKKSIYLIRQWIYIINISFPSFTLSFLVQVVGSIEQERKIEELNET